MSFQGNHSSRVAEEDNGSFRNTITKNPCSVKRQGIQFEVEQQRNNILVFCRGCETKIEIKIQEIPAAIVYLLRRNDLATMTENEKTITNIKEIERVRSDELQKLRKQVEMFAYEQQGWLDNAKKWLQKLIKFKGN